MKRSIYLCLALVFLTAWNYQDDHKKFVDVAGIDYSIKPGDNFFRFVNGRWYDTAKIASDQSGVGSYSFMNIPQKRLLQNILDSVSKSKNIMGSVEQKVGDFYASGMDTATINQRGYEPIKPMLARIDAISDISSLMKYVADDLKAGNSSIIGFGVYPDNQNSSINIAHVSQTGIGLPDRDYYFKTDPSTLNIQQAYKKYISTLFQLSGSDVATANKNADVAYGIEQQIAASHKTNIERRDVKANYHKVAIASINQTQANIGWTTLLANLGAGTDSIDMAQPAYYDTLNGLLRSIPINDWKIYLKADMLKDYSETLSESFADASFEFSKVLSGQATQKSRRQVMTENVDGYLGQALGQLYVKRYFNEDAKKRVLVLVNNLQKAFENRINHLDWMSDSTKHKAIEKLYAITKKLGYPDKWRSYDKVEISRTRYFENILYIEQNGYQYQLAKLNKPVDKTEWGTTPSTVTAYYNPFANEVVFPAGILQFPYFDFEADDAINYGGIGMVIGHEMTH
ncbi:MAG TPA: M13 family metallopeptidase, partial [Mucilaginibacter sp.]|nr:M13 family metallopeptidase [Mucilaginibacter sp.]